MNSFLFSVFSFTLLLLFVCLKWVLAFEQDVLLKRRSPVQSKQS